MLTQAELKQALTKALPQTDGPVSLKGLSAVAEVYRDAWGIPHVRAANGSDAFFVQGFVTAQDRLWQMEYDRRRGSGRWAEAVGSAGLEQDLLMRRFRLEASARADYQAVNEATRTMLDAYARGVNAYIDTAQAAGALPVEYAITGLAPEPWQPWDGLVAFKVRHILMGVFESKVWRAQLVRRLGPEKAAALAPGYQPGELQILPPGTPYAASLNNGSVDDGLAELTQSAAALNYLGETDSGSNSWALAGSRTASGKPLLAGDSHRALDTPNVYYPSHIACPEFDVVGLALPGVPGFPHFGHNDRVAWCITHTSADYQDLYIERFKEDNPEYYWYRGEGRRAEVFQETIQVRDGAPVNLSVYVTQHGPIISGPYEPKEGSGSGERTGVAFRYTATDGAKPWPEVIPAMLRARDGYALADSMRGWVDPCNNLVFADGDGNIGYLCRGEIPIRSMQNARLPVPGWTGEHEWTGNIPFEELPRSVNPESGYIVTANNKPVGDDYPYYISTEFTPGFRAERVTKALLALERPAAADMAKVHAERISIPALAYIDYLKANREQLIMADPLAAQALEKLLAWDGGMDADRVEPTIYSAFRDALLYRLFQLHLGEELTAEVWNPANRGVGVFLGRVRSLLITLFPEDDRRLLPAEESWPSLLAAALAEGVAALRTRLGDDLEQWRWDLLHQARPRHTLSGAFPELAGLLDPPTIPMAGDGDTPLAGAYAPADLATVGGLSVARYVFDLADWENSQWAIPLGASGRPASPHYHDQSDVWRRVRMVPMEYNWTGIIARSEAQQILEPG